MKPEQDAALREPFPPALIGKLPKANATLDFVGHAAVTDRLRQVDPEWNWEPFALDPDGSPLIRYRGTQAQLWIRLTVAGVTRPGVGIAEAKKAELEKELISDAIRNAAMRFGVALDLWSKEDLTYVEPEPTVTPEQAKELIGMMTLPSKVETIRMKQGFAQGFGSPNTLPASRYADARAWVAANMPQPESPEPDVPPALAALAADDERPF